MKTNHRRNVRKRNDAYHSKYRGAKGMLRQDTNRERRSAERSALRQFATDPEADVPLPIQNKHAGNPWRWD